MKIIAVGRNYAAHAAELDNEIPDSPVIFMKPETALLKHEQPFYYPDFTSEVHYEGELVLRVSQQGKAIEKRFANRYYDALTVGIDFTARDLQRQLKERQLSWELAKAFDNSAAVGSFLPVSDFADLKQVYFTLCKNQQSVQEGDTRWLLFHFDYLVSFISQYFTLKAGDLIFTGTPAGVGPVQIGDKFTGYLEDKHVLTCSIR